METDKPSSSPQTLFVLAGMPRAGTTFVYHAMSRHPHVRVGARKEFRFFSLNYNRGVNWYERQFAGAQPATLWADFSPDYFMFDGVVARMRQYHRPMRVALAVRDPAEWAVSLHRHLQTMEWRTPSFLQFLKTGLYPNFRLFSAGNIPATASSALTNGFISRRLREFRNAFGHNLLLYDFAFFQKEPMTVMSVLETFMGVPQWFNGDRLPNERIHARGSQRLRPLNYLLSREIVSEMLARLLPRRILLRARRWKEQGMFPREKKAVSPDNEKEDITIAREVLAVDGSYVGSMFADAPVILGDGSFVITRSQSAAIPDSDT